MAQRPSERTLLLALILVQVLFGGLAVAGKKVFPFMPPLALALCRVVAAAIILMALERALVRSPMPPRRDLARFALFALLGVALNQSLYLSGLQFTSATDAILLIATIPAFTLLVSVLLRRETAAPLKVAGLAVSFVGVIFLVARTGLSSGWLALLGDAMVLANSLSYSVFLVLSRKTLQRYDALTLIAWVFVFGAIEMTVVALPALVSVDWSLLTAEAWSWFAYALIGATVLTYGINNWVLRHTSASHVASFVYLQPLVGALLAAWLLGEQLTWHVAVAGALILAGVALASRAGVGRRAANPAE